MSELYGYAGKILRVDLSTGTITRVPTSDYARRFLGGRGIAAKIYWDEVPPEVRAFDPANRLIFATGPVAGLKGISGSRWVVCGKTALTTPEHFNYANLGGDWGAQLKLAGYDALVVQGKSD
ncbi:MAG: aldehyde ferredoxin oxidoreductase, partial [Chloroflexi bacterium]|nr:aldehyde ferredoxin oxidoreductase [Chloroflexota bacterium]